MRKLFPNHIIDLEKGTVFSQSKNKFLGVTKNKKGYNVTSIFDIYGNRYNSIHQIIVTEGLQLPKHLWPIDENGKRYVVDHITPVNNGGTNAFENLHLVPIPVNNRNPKTRENQSKAAIGRIIPEEQRQKMSDSHKGKKHPHKGKKQTKEHIENAAETRKIQVFQYTLNGELVGVWPSATDAEKELGINRQHIGECCRGKRKTAGGFKWSFVPL